MTGHAVFRYCCRFSIIALHNSCRMFCCMFAVVINYRFTRICRTIVVSKFYSRFCVFIVIFKFRSRCSYQYYLSYNMSLGKLWSGKQYRNGKKKKKKTGESTMAWKPKRESVSFFKFNGGERLNSSFMQNPNCHS